MTDKAKSPPIGASILMSEVRAAKTSEERNFWDKLLQMSEKEIAENKAAGKTRLYTPSAELKKLLRQAVDVYRGLQYREMRQLSGNFKF